VGLSQEKKAQGGGGKKKGEKSQVGAWPPKDGGRFPNDKRKGRERKNQPGRPSSKGEKKKGSKDETRGVPRGRMDHRAREKKKGGDEKVLERPRARGRNALHGENGRKQKDVRRGVFLRTAGKGRKTDKGNQDHSSRK